MKSISSAIILLCVTKYAVCQHYDGDSYDYSPESSDRDSEDDDSGFVTPLDFSPLFGGGIFGLSNSASNAQNKKSIFDAGGSESRLSGQNIFQDQSSSGKQFSPETFGFIPKFSQNFSPDIQSSHYQPKPIESEKPRGQLQFNIQTKHDNNYKKQPENKSPSLSTYKEIIPNSNVYPSVNSNPNYKIIQPKDLSRIKNDDHLAPYKKYSFQPQDVPLDIPNYKSLSSQYTDGSQYTQGVDPKLYRRKRYSGNRNQQKPRTEKKDEEDDSNYYYNSNYKSKPKEFDESSSYYSPDFSEFNNNQKEYDYGADEEYDFDEYERIKSISQQQAAEVNKNPGNCKKVQKDSMTCMVCQDPKNGGSYESCSYVSEPKNNKYAYVKEHKFDSNDEPVNQEESSKAEQKQKPDTTPSNKAAPVVKPQRNTPYRGTSKYHQNPTPQKQTQQPKYKGYYTQTHNPEIDSSETTKFAAYKQHNDKDYDDSYEFKSVQPDFFTDNEPKKNVEHVLAEFVKKDRSACKKVFKNEMTCYQCTDKTGLKHEECMFVSESAPKTSHLAYQEIKEFNSKPTASDAATGNTDVDSKVLFASGPNPTTLPLSAFSSISPFVDPTPKKKQLFKKYTNGGQEKKILLNPRPVELSKVLTKSITVGPVKRSVKKIANGSPINNNSPSEYSLDSIANPLEFSSESKGAFWAETIPRYSRELDVSLPKYMLTKSHHEEIFDDFLSGK